MKKKYYPIISYFVFAFSLFIIAISFFSQDFTITNITKVIYSLTLCALLFCSGSITDKEKNYKINIICYMIIYFILLISITMFSNRSGLGIITKEYFDYYINTINLIPFKTIFEYIFGNSGTLAATKNIIGNLIMLMPLSILLIIKDDKYLKLRKQLPVILITVSLIEFTQFLLCVGQFDIDDFILNAVGAIIITLILRKNNILSYLRNLFYKKINIFNKLQYILFFLLVVLIMLVNCIIIYEKIFL